MGDADRPEEVLQAHQGFLQAVDYQRVSVRSHLGPAALYVGQSPHVVAMPVGQEDVLKTLGVDAQLGAVTQRRIS